MLSSFFQAQASPSGTLPSNTIPNPKGEMKAITTRSGVAYEGPSNPTKPSPKKVVEREAEEITDEEQNNPKVVTAQIPPTVIPNNSGNPRFSKNFPKSNRYRNRDSERLGVYLDHEALDPQELVMKDPRGAIIAPISPLEKFFDADDDYENLNLEEEEDEEALRTQRSRIESSMLVIKFYSSTPVELSQPDGPNFKVNGHRVKHYFGGDIPPKVVPDLHTLPKDN
ncbi:hypothetical protein Tco_0678198 [Tanacetum coccineum]|uniref:Reverse transcriptase domain-containing protein n=1 Tax=Tanacetum coccineum TaxID=301880 RepID=A0ABQ4XEA9_9ASTR